MTQQHPITPPPELVQQWRRSAPANAAVNNAYERHIATQAAQWGADQELLACGNYLKQCAAWEEEDVTEFYNYRRPKPPSLKEQALEDLDSLIADLANHGMGFKITNILRALEQLPDNEQALDLLDKAEDPSWDINDFSIIRRVLELLDD